MQQYRSGRVQGCTIRKLEKPGVIEELQNTKEKETKGEIRSEGGQDNIQVKTQGNTKGTFGS